jgi:hypothetical protein
MSMSHLDKQKQEIIYDSLILYKFFRAVSHKSVLFSGFWNKEQKWKEMKMHLGSCTNINEQKNFKLSHNFATDHFF